MSTAQQPDIEEVIKPPMADEEFSGNRRVLRRWETILLAVLCVGFTVFHLYVLNVYSLEALLFRIITLGFVLLSLTLGSGFVFSEELFGQAARFNHKTVFGILSWIIFAALLVGRYGWGWRGRTALRWTLAGFAALLLAYVGSMFVLEVILGKV